MVSKQLKNSLLKNSKPITVAIPTEQYDYAAIERGLMANLIHSLDSSNIHMLVKKIIDDKLELNLYTIHDCFASTSGEMAIIEKLIREVFANIYFSKDYVSRLDSIITAQIKEDENVYQKGDKFFFKNNSKPIELDIPKLPSYN